ncbi:MAG: hypothetical protein AB8C13_04920 [Phycisphaerales bacterium]
MTPIRRTRNNQSNTTPAPAIRASRALLLSVAASGLILSGCSKNDDAKEAVSEASLEFRNVSIGDPTSSSQVAQKAYSSAADLTSEFAGQDAPFGEAAAVSLALAKLGTATLSGSEAHATETQSFHQSRIIRAHLSEWIAMNAVAKASTNYDVTEARAGLEELITLRKQDVEQYTTLHDSMRQEIADFQRQIDSLNSQAVTQRNESAGFELQMTSVSATQAAQLAERVREHSLRADTYELESTRLQGRVDQLLPGANEVTLQVKRAEDQISLLEESIAELNQQVIDSKADSAQARANAEQAYSSLVELVNALESYRSETVIPASERVISQIRQSLSASRDANATAKVSGSIAKATAQEQLARTLARQARGETDMFSLYQSIHDAGIKGDWQSKIDSHTMRFQELTEESRQAFQDSANALRSVRVRGEAADALEAAAVRLDRLGGIEPEPEYTEEYEDDSDFDDSETDEDADYEDEPVDDEG